MECLVLKPYCNSLQLICCIYLFHFGIKTIVHIYKIMTNNATKNEINNKKQIKQQYSIKTSKAI